MHCYPITKGDTLHLAGRTMTNGDLDQPNNVTNTPNKQQKQQEQRKVSIHLCDPKSNLYQQLINQYSGYSCQGKSTVFSFNKIIVILQIIAVMKTLNHFLLTTAFFHQIWQLDLIQNQEIHLV